MVEMSSGLLRIQRIVLVEQHHEVLLLSQHEPTCGPKPARKAWRIVSHLKLRIVEPRIETPDPHKVLVHALFDHPSPLNDHDAIDIMERGQPMGDNEGGSPRHQVVDGLAN